MRRALIFKTLSDNQVAEESIRESGRKVFSGQEHEVGRFTKQLEMLKYQMKVVRTSAALVLFISRCCFRYRRAHIQH